MFFCLYAEDSGLFEKKNQFHDYLSQYSAENIREALKTLFKVLNTKNEERDPYLSEQLKAFPYVNGGLFADESVLIPPFTDELRTMLLDQASDEFDWSDISPTIFGAVFESTLNPETRRRGGMHYTSIENIHKVIDPLFLDDLKDEFNEIMHFKREKIRNEHLRRFQDKLASLRFLESKVQTMIQLKIALLPEKLEGANPTQGVHLAQEGANALQERLNFMVT